MRIQTAKKGMVAHMHGGRHFCSFCWWGCHRFPAFWRAGKNPGFVLARDGKKCERELEGGGGGPILPGQGGARSGGRWWHRRPTPLHTSSVLAVLRGVDGEGIRHAQRQSP